MGNANAKKRTKEDVNKNITNVQNNPTTEEPILDIETIFETETKDDINVKKIVKVLLFRDIKGKSQPFDIELINNSSEKVLFFNKMSYEECRYKINNSPGVLETYKSLLGDFKLDKAFLIHDNSWKYYLFVFDHCLTKIKIHSQDAIALIKRYGYLTEPTYEFEIDGLKLTGECHETDYLEFEIFTNEVEITWGQFKKVCDINTYPLDFIQDKDIVLACIDRKSCYPKEDILYKCYDITLSFVSYESKRENVYIFHINPDLEKGVRGGKLNYETYSFVLEYQGPFRYLQNILPSDFNMDLNEYTSFRFLGVMTTRNSNLKMSSIQSLEATFSFRNKNFSRSIKLSGQKGINLEHENYRMHFRDHNDERKYSTDLRKACEIAGIQNKEYCKEFGDFIIENIHYKDGYFEMKGFVKGTNEKVFINYDLNLENLIVEIYIDDRKLDFFDFLIFKLKESLRMKFDQNISFNFE